MAVNYVVLGDSIQWGQGLFEEDKFTTLVAREIERIYGVEAKCIARYAHSAAKIGGSSAGSNADSTASGFAGEVPSSSPSIWSQFNTLKKAIDEDDRESVNLILMDGGINPGPIEILLNPGGSADDLRTATEASCFTDMRELLGEVDSAFPNAYIVVTGYYPIFSTYSVLSSVGVFAIGMLTALGYTTGAITSVLGGGGLANLIHLSNVFEEESERHLRQAVADVNRPNKVAYAHVPFGPHRCLFVTGTSWLWGFGSLPPLPGSGYFDLEALFAWVLTLTGLAPWLRAATPADPVRHERQVLCRTLDFECNWASVGHPDIGGAKQYCNSIMAALSDMSFDPVNGPEDTKDDSKARRSAAAAIMSLERVR